MRLAVGHAKGDRYCPLDISGLIVWLCSSKTNEPLSTGCAGLGLQVIDGDG
ncbi:hypothetical protein [Moorena sp. SIO3A2]|uniref:hypothetical protein n=1 Tax=Moorena sp. SIO3A2 TaxID=2607841 RepID=UPI0013B6A174|nr:hypothetical protein [Moorena sp. SIO3A2]NER92199.1 hypothetical protein [Moorena sp. SIO3A2]